MISFRLSRGVRRVVASRRAATTVEYGLICALIVLAMVSALRGVAESTIGMWNYVSLEAAGAMSR